MVALNNHGHSYELLSQHRGVTSQCRGRGWGVGFGDHGPGIRGHGSHIPLQHQTPPFLSVDADTAQYKIPVTDRILIIIVDP
uniref:Uncharacterized protein n=1 Tax=Amphimedon queenslandica TaxID=400682 RepID=A0A1X7UJK0_AMPQE